MGRICWNVVSVVFLLVTLTCTEEQPYSTEDSVGKIVGLIKPTGIIAQISLMQGKILKTTQSDSTGYFRIDSVTAGVYNLEIAAEGFGRHIVNEVIVYSQRTSAISDVYLKPFPDQILALNPANGTRAYPVNAPIKIEFNIPMMHSSVENSFSLDPQVEGYFIWEDSAEKSKVTFYPDDQFATNTTYLMSLTTGAETIYGDTLSFQLSASFETEGIKITTTIPDDQATFISPQTGIYVYFNSIIERHTFEENFSIIPTIDGVFKWYDSKRVSFQPYIPLASNTTFVVSVGGNVQDIFGTQLIDDETFSFHTESLAILTSYPANGATFMSRSTPISISFNTHVNQESVQNSFRLSPEVESWNFQWYDLSRFQYSGTTKLAANTLYTVTIDTTCTDAWGNMLPKNFKLIFTTGN